MFSVTTFFWGSFFLSTVTAYVPPLGEFLLSESTSEKIIVLIFFSRAYSWKQDFLGFLKEFFVMFVV